MAKKIGQVSKTARKGKIVYVTASGAVMAAAPKRRKKKAKKR